LFHTKRMSDAIQEAPSQAAESYDTRKTTPRMSSEQPKNVMFTENKAGVSSTEALEAALEAIKKRLQEGTEDEGYREFLIRRGLLEEETDWKERYSRHQQRLFNSMAETNDPWIQSWKDRKVKATLQADDLPSTPETDSISFGKLASYMEFNKFDPRASSASVREPIRIRAPVKAVISEKIFTSPPNEAHINWIHLPANNMSWVEVNNLGISMELLC